MEMVASLVHGSIGSLKYRVLLGLKGMPAHVWGMSAVERILGSNYAKLDPTLAIVDGEDRRCNTSGVSLA